MVYVTSVLHSMSGLLPPLLAALSSGNSTTSPPRAGGASAKDTTKSETAGDGRDEVRG